VLSAFFCRLLLRQHRSLRDALGPTWFPSEAYVQTLARCKLITAAAAAAAAAAAPAAAPAAPAATAPPPRHHCRCHHRSSSRVSSAVYIGGLYIVYNIVYNQYILLASSQYSSLLPLSLPGYTEVCHSRTSDFCVLLSIVIRLSAG
jgi:hypothetical protein